MRLSTGQYQCHAAGGCLIACGVYDWQYSKILRLLFIRFISRNRGFVYRCFFKLPIERSFKRVWKDLCFGVLLGGCLVFDLFK